MVRPGDAAAVDTVEAWFLDHHATGDRAIRADHPGPPGLADRLAGRFRGGNGVTGEDLVQSARVGLVSAVDRYDLHRANPFIAYAIVCINGELRRCLRDSSWRIHVARTLKELALRVSKARDALTANFNRSPTLAEISDHLGVDVEQVAEALEVIDTRRQLSLDQPAHGDGAASFGSLLPAPAGEIEDRLSLPDLFDRLGDQDRQIGNELGYSQMHVSRMLRRALHQQLMS